MSIEPLNAGAALASAAAGAAAIAADAVSSAIFGVPLSMIVACFSGALFGATWFPPESQVSRPWAVFVNTLAGIFLASVVLHLAQLPKPLSAAVGFAISAAPLFFFRWLQSRTTQAPPPAPPTAGAQGGQP